MLNTDLLLEASIEMTNLTNKIKLENLKPFYLREDDNKIGFKERIKKIIDTIKKFLIKLKNFIKEKWMSLRSKYNSFIIKLSNKATFTKNGHNVMYAPNIFVTDKHDNIYGLFQSMKDLVSNTTYEIMDDVRSKLDHDINFYFVKKAECRFHEFQSWIVATLKECCQKTDCFLREIFKEINKIKSELERLTSSKEDNNDKIVLANFKIVQFQKIITYLFRFISIVNSMIQRALDSDSRKDFGKESKKSMDKLKKDIKNK